MKRLLCLVGVLISFALSECQSLKAESESSEDSPLNVLFIISDDLTATALSCYGNTVCQTPVSYTHLTLPTILLV